MSRVSFANMAESESRPFARLMSATCRHVCLTLRTWLFLSNAESYSTVLLTSTWYLTAKPASVSNFDTCRAKVHN